MTCPTCQIFLIELVKSTVDDRMCFPRAFGGNVWLDLSVLSIDFIFFDSPLNVKIYSEFLQNQIHYYLSNFPLLDCSGTMFQQDDAPVYNSNFITNYVDEYFHRNFFGTNVRVCWLARALDLTLLYSGLYGRKGWCKVSRELESK